MNKNYKFVTLNKILSRSRIRYQAHTVIRIFYPIQPRFVSYNIMPEAKEFPPQKVRAIVAEVAALLKEKNETISVAETVCLFYAIPFLSCTLWG